MLKVKKGASIFSLVLCAVIVALVTTALVVTTSNYGLFMAQRDAKNDNVVEKSAYTKVYTIEEVKTIARSAYANNYLAFYDNEVTFDGFEQLIMKEIANQIPQEQLGNYIINITPDGIDVQAK